MNSVQLIGNISTEIDLRYTPTGTAVAKFNLAVTNPFNREKTSFIPVEVWKRSAENLAEFCAKGSKLGVVGTIEVDQYEKDGQKRTFTKVVANNVEFLTPRSGGEQRNEQSNTNTGGGNSNHNSGGFTRVDDDPFSGPNGQIDISSDDLPF